MNMKEVNKLIVAGERQELLERMMAEEIEHIRKIVMPYSRSKEVFWHPVHIQENSELNEETGGRFTFIKNDEEYINNIEINTYYIDEYIFIEDEWWRRYYIRQLRGVIGHELTHAYVGQRFHNVSKNIKGINRDASPVFLATLRLFRYYSGHKCGSYFYNNTLADKTWDIVSNNTVSKRWELFYPVILDYINNITRSVNYFNNKQDELSINNLNNYASNIVRNKISVEFGGRNIGLTKETSVGTKNKYLGNRKITNIENNISSFSIGSSMQNVDKIMELIKKKINNGTEAKYDVLYTNKIKMDDNMESCKTLQKTERKNY